ncbi:MAG: HAD-IA family hydrolase [Paracoccaceae bacterium]|nr:MAG: HAD-IA family hydrolase [Paracoccaceae bacterium]
MPDAIIFDVDGTLAETEEVHRRAFNETFARMGLLWHWTGADYARLLTTTGGKERIRRHMDETGAPPTDVAMLHAAKTERYVQLIAEGQIVLREGIGALVVAARRAGLKLAVATTTSRPNVEALARAVWGRSASEVFDVIAAGDEVAAKKPAPDVYRLALDRLGLPAARTVALEDSRNGLRAAIAAGIPCIVSPGIYTRAEDFSGALAVLPEFSALGGLDGLAALLERHAA